MLELQGVTDLLRGMFLIFLEARHGGEPAACTLYDAPEDGCI